MIDILKGLVFGTFDRTTAKEREALDMVIKLQTEPSADVIPIPRGATNGDMIKAMFDIPDSEIDEGLSTTYIYTSKRVLKGGSQDYLREYITFSGEWWNAPYKGNLSEKPTGSESEDKE
jgi:hypothetical protein